MKTVDEVMEVLRSLSAWGWEVAADLEACQKFYREIQEVDLNDPEIQKNIKSVANWNHTEIDRSIRRTRALINR